MATNVLDILERYGFRWQQGNTYFGGESVNAVTLP